MKDKAIIWLYQHTPAKLRSQRLIDAAGAAADREIAKAKRYIISKRWEKVRLQEQLFELRGEERCTKE